MLRYDFESSRRLLYSGAIKTWFKAILENRKMLFLVLQVVVFFKNSRRRPEQPHETYVFFKNCPRRAEYIMKLIFYFQNLHQNVKIEIVYTSDTMKFTHFFKKSPGRARTPWNLHICFKNSPRRAVYTMKLMLFFKKITKQIKQTLNNSKPI